MREYKFRAWDKIDKRLIIDKQDFIPLIVTSKGVFKLDATCEYDRWIEIDKNRFDLMQYTGLFDKRGIEIYEGDIVKYDFNNLNYRIEFINAEFIARRFYENIENLYPTEFDYGKECEVIGNIYENPELLN